MSEVKWKVLSGKHYHRGKCFTKGEVFFGKKSLGEVFKGKLERVMEEKDFEEEEKEEQSSPNVGLILQKVTKNKYNVVNEITGKPINDEPLSYRKAKSLIEGESSKEEDKEEEE